MTSCNSCAESLVTGIERKIGTCVACVKSQLAEHRAVIEEKERVLSRLVESEKSIAA